MKSFANHICKHWRAVDKEREKIESQNLYMKIYLFIIIHTCLLKNDWQTYGPYKTYIAHRER